MDPVTATMNAIAAFFTFANSSEGQQALADFRKIDEGFNAKLKGLFDHIFNQTAAPAAAPKQ